MKVRKYLDAARAQVALAELRASEALAIEPAADLFSFLFEDPEVGYEVRDGVAILAIDGLLTQRGSWWGLGYDAIEATFGRALADSSVDTVAFRVNSPGGDVAGLFDVVRRMRGAADASGKRVVALSDERMYSAAYALACVADEIVVPQTGGAGSVGVIAALASFHRSLQADGVDMRVVTSGAQKADGHPALPLSEDVVQRMQARVNELAGIFVKWVAERRAMTQTAVRDLEAGVRYGQRAVDAGLADRVAPVESVIEELGSSRQAGGSAGGKVGMNEKQKALLAAVAALTSEQDEQAAEGKLRAMAAQAARAGEAIAEADGLRAKLAEVEKAQRHQAREAALDERRKNGRLTPSMEKADGFRALVEASSDEAFRAYLAQLDTLPVRTHREEPDPARVAAEQPRANRFAAQVGLQDDDLVKEEN